jgi:hypothetical protein
MRRLGRAAWLGVVLALLAPVTPASAQATATDEAVARARMLVESGNGRAGRLVLDSMVNASGVATPALGELLYWRGLLSESSTDAERDWRRLLLDAPMSPRAEDALLRLAQLEQMRGRPAASRALLDRLVREHREPASQARAHFWLAKAWFDENDRPRACGALDVVRREAPPSAVELRTQADDLHSRCRGVTPVTALVAEAPRGAALARPVATIDSTRVDESVAPGRNAAGRDAAGRPADARFSVQLAASNTRIQADQVVQRLAVRGIEARVDGEVAPFRVRTGYFTTRAQAAARLVQIRSQGFADAFIAELTP